jgi:hypothetical protein
VRGPDRVPAAPSALPNQPGYPLRGACDSGFELLVLVRALEIDAPYFHERDSGVVLGNEASQPVGVRRARRQFRHIAVNDQPQSLDAAPLARRQVTRSPRLTHEVARIHFAAL